MSLKKAGPWAHVPAYRRTPAGAGPRSLRSDRPPSVPAPQGTEGRPSQGPCRVGSRRPSAGSSHTVTGRGSQDTQAHSLNLAGHTQAPRGRRCWVQAACSHGALRATAHGVQAPRSPLPRAVTDAVRRAPLGQSRLTDAGWCWPPHGRVCCPGTSCCLVPTATSEKRDHCHSSDSPDLQGTEPAPLLSGERGF